MVTYTEKITSSALIGDSVAVETDTDPENCNSISIFVHDTNAGFETNAWLTSSDVDLLVSALRTAQNRLRFSGPQR